VLKGEEEKRRKREREKGREGKRGSIELYRIGANLFPLFHIGLQKIGVRIRRRYVYS